MAEAGIGVDLVEIARMESIERRTPSFFARMFTDEERMYCEASARPAAHYACRFAAREAVLKALGTGFGQDGVGRCDVSVSRDANGRPIAVLSGGALEVAKRLGVVEVAISLSFTEALAVANAMAITDDARPKPKEEKMSERQRISQSFREARAVLDELDRMQDFELMSLTGDVVSPIASVDRPVSGRPDASSVALGPMGANTDAPDTPMSMRVHPDGGSQDFLEDADDAVQVHNDGRSESPFDAASIMAVVMKESGL